VTAYFESSDRGNVDFEFLFGMTRTTQGCQIIEGVRMTVPIRINVVNLKPVSACAYRALVTVTLEGIASRLFPIRVIRGCGASAPEVTFFSLSILAHPSSRTCFGARYLVGTSYDGKGLVTHRTRSHFLSRSSPSAHPVTLRRTILDVSVRLINIVSRSALLAGMFLTGLALWACRVVALIPSLTPLHGSRITRLAAIHPSSTSFELDAAFGTHVKDRFHMPIIPQMCMNPAYVKLAEKRIGHAQPALFGI
jgi:hypothetical protein